MIILVIMLQLICIADVARGLLAGWFMADGKLFFFLKSRLL